MARYDPHDRFFRKARAAGLPSRAAFKLEELIARFKLARAGDCVIDLGCAPGGWIAILARVRKRRRRSVQAGQRRNLLNAMCPTKRV